MKSRRRFFREVRRWGTRVLALILANSRLEGAPTGAQVVSGEAAVAVHGSLTTVTAGNNAMVRWSGFDVGQAETVQFIQPGAASRILNLIGSLSPSQIDGTVRSNGQVYLLNPSGIYFGRTAVVDVGGLFAIGGSISKEDFLAGINRFTSLFGSVRNEGSLHGQTVALIGSSISNSGSIVAPDGFAGLVAGEQVLLYREGSRILVEAGRTTVPEVSSPGVSNTGRIAVGQGSAVLAAGDLYSVAISHQGLLSARDVRLEGQGGGDVLVTGTIDASSAEMNQSGGRVTITGDRIGLLAGSMIDASGDAGGGEIRVGGDYQGANAEVRNARTTLIAGDASLHADARGKGKGGRVIIWSDQTTIFAGELSARGGSAEGEGGFAEISGKEHLRFTGQVDLTAVDGSRGSLLLDPTNITIQSAGPDRNGDATLGDDITLATDLDSATLDFSGKDSLITGAAVSGLLNTTALTLAATNNITVNEPVSWNSGFGLTLNAGNKIAVAAEIKNSGVGGITLDSGAGGIALGANLSTSGAIVVNNGGAVTQTSGRVTAASVKLEGGGSFGTSAAGRISVSTASLELAKSGGSVFIDNRRSGGFSVDGSSTGATVNLRSSDAATTDLQPLLVGADGLTAGAITLTGSSVTATGTLTTTVGAVGLGANTNVTLTAGINSKGAADVAFGTTGPGILTVGGSVTAPGKFTAAGGAGADQFVLNTLVLGDATLAGGGGIDSVSIGGAGAQTVEVTANNTFSVGKVDFSSIEKLDAGGGTDRVTLPNANNAVLITGSNAATMAGIEFSQIEAIEAGGGGDDTVTLTENADTFTVSAKNQGSVSGISLTEIEAVDGAGGSDTLINGTGSEYTAGGTAIAGINFSNFEKVSTPALKLTGADDTFDVTGAGTGVHAGVEYLGLTSVDAAGGSDTVNLTAGDNAFTVSGTGAGSALGISFTNIEALDGKGGTDTLINGTGSALTAGAAFPGGLAYTSFEKISTAALKLTGADDTFDVTGSGTGVHAGVEYSGLTSVDASGGTDTINLTAGDNSFSVSGTGAGSALGIAFTNIEAVDGKGGADTLTNATGSALTAGTAIVGGISYSNFETISTAALKLSAGADTFTVTGSGSGAIGGVAYIGLSTVDALGDKDTILFTASPETLVLNSTGEVKAASITFSNIEVVDGGGGGDSLSLTGGADSVLVTGTEAFTVGGIDFKAIPAVAAAGGKDTVTLTPGDDSVTVTADQAFSTWGIHFTQIEIVDTAGGAADSVTLPGSDDTFTVTGALSGTSNAINFTGIESVEGGAGVDTLANDTKIPFATGSTSLGGIAFTGFESIETPALALSDTTDDVFTLTGNGKGSAGGTKFQGLLTVDALGGLDRLLLTTGNDSVQYDGPAAVTVGGIAFANFETIAGSGGSDTVTLTTGADLIAVSKANEFTVGGMLFEAFADVNANSGADHVVLSAGGDAIEVTGANAVKAAGVQFLQIESLNAWDGTDSLTLTAGDDSITVTADNAVTTSGIAFTSIERVLGSGGSDSVKLGPSGESILIVGAKAVSVAKIAFEQIESVDAAGGVDILVLTSGDDSVTVQGTGAATTAGIAFSSVETLLGSGGVDSVTFSTGDDTLQVSAANVLTGAGMVLNQFTKVSGGAGKDTVFLSAGTDLMALTGTQEFTTWGMAFSAIEAVEAGGGEDTLTLTALVDAVTVEGLNRVRAGEISFGGVEHVDGNGGADGVTMTANADLITITGANRFLGSSINFSKIFTVSGGGGVDIVSLSAASETITLTGQRAAAVSGISFTEIETIDAGGGVDEAVLTAGDNAVAVSGLRSIEVLGLALMNIEKVAGNGGSDSVALGPAGDAVFLTGSNAFTTAGIDFSAFSALDGGGGQDSVTLTAGGDEIAAIAPGSVATGGVIFSNIESVGAGGGSDNLTLTGAGDLIRVIGLNGLTALGITFSGIDSVVGGAGYDSLVLTPAGDFIQLTGPGALSTWAITFSEIEGLDAGGGNDILTLTGGSDNVTLSGSDVIRIGSIDFSSVETIVGGGGKDTVTLTSGPDDVVVTGEAAFTTAGVTFQQFGAVIGAGGFDTARLTGAPDSIQLDGPQAATAWGIAFTQFEAFDGAGGADTLTLTTGSDQVDITASGRMTTGGIDFTGIESVVGGGGNDSAALTPGPDVVQVIGTGSFLTSGIGFAGFASVAGGGGNDSVLLTSNADSLSLTGPGAFTSYGLRFTQFASVDGGGASDTLTLTPADDTVTVLGTGSLSVGSIDFSHVENIVGGGGSDTVVLGSRDDLIALVGVRAFINSGLSFTGFGTLDGGSGKDQLMLTAGNDEIFVEGANTVRAFDVRFLQIETVDAGEGAEDKVNLTAGTDVVQLTGTRSITTAGVDFLGIERVDGGQGANSLTLTDSDDVVNVDTLSAFRVGGIAFTTFQTLAGGGGADSIILGSSPDTITLIGAQSFSTYQIDFTQFEGLDAGGGADTLLLPASDNAVVIAGENALTAAGVSFTHLESVVGGAGFDLVTLTNQNDSLTLKGTTSFESFGLSFTGFEAVDAGQGVDTLTLTAGDDAIDVVGDKQVGARGVSFRAFEAVRGGGGRDVVTLTEGDDLVELTASNAFIGYGVAFSEISAVDGNTGRDQMVLTSGADRIDLVGDRSANVLGMSFSHMEAIDGAGGLNAAFLTEGDDTITVTGARAARTFGIDLSNLDSIDGRGGIDGVLLTPGDDLLAIRGQNAFSTSGITLVGVENVDAGAGFNRLEVTGNNDAIAVTDTRQLRTWGLSFSRIDTVDAMGGQDRVTLTNAPDTIEVKGQRAATVSAIAFSNVEEIDAAGGANTVRLTPGDDEVRVLGEDSIAAAGIAFLAIQTVDGSQGKDRVILPDQGDSVRIVADHKAVVDKLTFVGIEAIDGGGGANMLSGTADVENWSVSGINAGALRGIEFERFATLKSGGTGTDVFMFTTTTADITGLISGEGASVRLENASDGLVTVTAPVVAPALRLGATGAGGFRVVNPANEVSTLAAAVGGSLFFRNSGSFNIGSVSGLTGVSAGGDLLLDASTGTMALSAPVSAGRNATLSAGEVNQDALVSAGGSDGSATLEVRANTGAIVMGPDAVGRTAGGSLRYQSAAEIVLGHLDAGVGGVSVLAAEGVVDGNGSRVNLTGTAARIDAGAGSIGEAANALETDLGQLAFSTGRDIYLQERTGIEIKGLASIVTHQVLVDGSLGRLEDGALLTQPVLGNFHLQADGPILVTAAEGGNLDAGGSLLLTTRSGDLTTRVGISSGRDLTLVSAGSVRVESLLSAGGVADIDATGGDLTMSAPSTLSAASAVRLAASRAIELATVTSDTISVIAGSDVSATPIAAGNHLTARTVRLESGGDVGSGKLPLTMSAGMVAAKTGGDLYVAEQDGLTVGLIEARATDRARFLSPSISVADAAIEGLNAGGDLVLTSGNGGQGDLSLVGPVHAGGDLLVKSGAGGLAIDAPVSAGNNLTATSRTSLRQRARLSAGLTNPTGTLDLAAEFGGLEMAEGAAGSTSGGAVRYAAGGSVRLGEINAGAGPISVNAGGSIEDANGAAVNLTGSRVRLEATSGSIGTLTDPIDSATRNLEARANGNVVLLNSGPLTLGGVGAVGVARIAADGGRSVVEDGHPIDGIASTGAAAGRSISITTHSGDLTVAPGARVRTSESVTTSSASGELSIRSGTEVLAGASIAGGGELSATAIAGDVRSAGELSLQGVRVLTSGADRGQVLVGAGSSITLKGADTAAFGSDTVLLAPLDRVARIEAARNVVIGAAIKGDNLGITADVDGLVAPGDGAGGGIRIERTGSVEVSNTLSLRGSALAGSSAPAGAPVILEVIGVGADSGGLQAGGDLRVDASTQAPAGARIMITGLSDQTGAGLNSTRGNVSLTPAPGGSILLEGGGSSAPLISAGKGVELNASVSIGGPVLIASTGAGNVTFNGSVDGIAAGAGNLAVQTAGVTRFAAQVGASQALGALTTSPGVRTEMNGGLIRTEGAQSYGGAVVLQGDTTLEASSLTFGQGVRSATDGASALRLNVSGATIVNGAIGDGGQRLSQLSMDGQGTIRLNSGTIATTGSQTYSDAVLLGGVTTLSGSAITFERSIESAADSTGSLTINSSGLTAFNAPVGQTRRVGELTTDAAGSTSVRANLVTTGVSFGDAVTFEGLSALSVESSGPQTYSGPVKLGVDVALNSTSGNVTLSQGAGGSGRALQIAARAGSIVAGGDLGGASERLRTVQLSGRDVTVNNLFTTGDLMVDIGREPGSATTMNGYLQITGEFIESEKGAVILGSGAGTPSTDADDRTEAPLRSSIFKSNPGDLLIAGANVTVQPFERMVVRDGNLVIFGDDSITLSNTAASQTLALVSPQIRLRSREPEPVLLGDGAGNDRGTDLVAGRVIFFRGGVPDAPTRADLGKLDLTKSQGTLLTNSPEVITLVPTTGQSPQTVLIADLAEERSVLRPLLAQLVYLDYKTAPGITNGLIIPPSRFGGESDRPLPAITAAGQLRASLDQVYVPVLPRTEQALEPAEADLAPALREQLQALGIYSRALMRWEQQSRGRRAGTFVVVPERPRPFESDYEVVDARVEGASVREVLRLAAETGLVGDQTRELSSVADALAEIYELFYEETRSEDGLRFRAWLKDRKGTEVLRVARFFELLRATLRQIEILGLTRHELEVSKSQIYGSILRPRLNADADFLRMVVEGTLENESMKPIDSRTPSSDSGRPRS